MPLERRTKPILTICPWQWQHEFGKRSLASFRSGFALRRVAAADCSTAALSEPDMRTTHPALWIDIQNPSESWADAGGWLSSFQAVLSEVIRPANHAGG